MLGQENNSALTTVGTGQENNQATRLPTLKRPGPDSPTMEVALGYPTFRSSSVSLLAGAFGVRANSG